MQITLKTIGKILPLLITLWSCNRSDTKGKETLGEIDSILSIKCHLSAFAMESDDFPSISGDVDFVSNVNSFEKSFYDPKRKGSKYSLSQNELKELYAAIKKLKVTSHSMKYKCEAADAPSSNLLIRTQNSTYEIDDYCLQGSETLKTIYGIVYRTGFPPTRPAKRRRAQNWQSDAAHHTGNQVPPPNYGGPGGSKHGTASAMKIPIASLMPCVQCLNTRLSHLPSKLVWPFQLEPPGGGSPRGAGAPWAAGHGARQPREYGSRPAPGKASAQPEGPRRSR